MRINTNTAALNSYNQLSNTNNNLSKSLSRLSSGKRINGAADDAAGLAISEKMGSQTRGLGQAQRNAQDGISMIQTAEGALKESHSILQRMRELSVQSANDTNTSEDRAEIQKEVDQLAQELTRIGETTEFNTQKLLDGDLDETKFQIGANEDQNMDIAINDMRAEALGVSDQATTGASTTDVDMVDGESYNAQEFDSTSATGDFADVTDVMVNSDDEIVATSTNGKEFSISDGTDTVSLSDAEDSTSATLATGATLDFGDNDIAGAVSITIDDDEPLITAETGINVSDQENANEAIATLDDSIKQVSAERSKLGAVQNRLDHTINNLNTAEENLTAAESRVSDVDMAKEMMSMSKEQILSQAGTAMMAQANQLPQGVLQLLG